LGVGREFREVTGLGASIFLNFSGINALQELLRTPNSELPTPNPELPTPNSQLQKTFTENLNIAIEMGNI
jgi:hypothetical protein